MSTRRRPTIDIGDPAVQEVCAAVLSELLHSRPFADRHRRPAHVPAMLSELKLTPTWWRVLVAAARWTCDEEGRAPACSGVLLPRVSRSIRLTMESDGVTR